MNVGFNKGLVTQISNKANEPEWMLDLRLKALDKYFQLPVPRLTKTKIDKWNIDKFILATEQPEQNLDDLPIEIQTLIINNKDSNLLVQKNSTVIFQKVSEVLANRGVILTDLNSALKDYPELIKKYFMDSTAYDENKLVALHTALWSGGLFLYVPGNTEVEIPVQAIFIGTETGMFPHILIIAEDNSSLTYVDHYYSIEPEKSSLHNGVVEIYVGENANVRFASIHNFNRTSYDYTHRKAIVKRNGRIEWIIGEMNSGNTVSTNESRLEETAATADSKSIFIGTGNQQTNFEAKVVHIGDYTESNILSHGVMADDSIGIFNGITKIEKGAVKSNAAQAEKVLMLSHGARGDVNPILLIDEHDVIAGHAASAGPVDSNDIYYLMSRGITREEAERLIIHGFLTPVVSRIPIEGLQEELKNVIERKLKK